MTDKQFNAALSAIRAFGKKSSSSRARARKLVIEIVLVDERGNLTKAYRDLQHEAKSSPRISRL